MALEFYFNAQIVGQSGSSVRSAEPYLTISETATPVYQTQVKLPTTVTAQSITNAQFSVSSSEGTITKTINLTPTTTAGVYSGGLPLLIDNGTYTITVKNTRILK